jgi:hypothetical protein
VVTQVPGGGLTSVEQSLVEHVGRGEWLDLAADDEAIDEATMWSWGRARTCRATVIREILRGRLAAEPDPHGLRLRGARITGRLDLANLSTKVNFELRDCLLEEGIVAPDAHLATVGLSGCHLEHPTEPPLDADRLTCNMLILIKATIIGHAKTGAVLLRGAHIGLLHCGGARLCNDSGPGLRGDGLQVGRGMYLHREFTATGTGQAGTVRLTGARIGGGLECDGASLRNDSGPALLADDLQVGQDISLREGFTATGSGENGAVCLAGAHIDCSLVGDGASLHNDSGPALFADGLQVGLDMLCDRLTADGGVVLGGHIGRLLSLAGAALNNRGGFALFSDGLRVDGTMFCRNGFTAQGQVRLPGARIGGRLYFDGAKLSNPGGRAFVGQRLTVGQDMYCRNRGGPEHEQPFVAEGAADLRGAHIGGHLDCTGAQLRNDSGPALYADSLQVDQDMLMRSGFTATGGGEDGAVRLSGAHIGGNLDCTGAALRNDSGPVLFAGGLQAGQDMYLTGGFTATGGGADVTIDLTGARVGGTLAFDHPARLEHAADPHRRLAVDGLTYAGVPQPIPARAWLDLLRNGSPGYAAQPYQQLAAGYRALGDERQAREILIAQRDDELTRTNTRWSEKLWGKVTKVTLGYGYKPWRALLFLTGVVVASCVLAVVLGAHGALAQTTKTATPGRSCTVVQQVSVGLDLNLPVGTSVARAACDLTTDSASATAAWLTAVGWVLRALAWVFAALFIAGFTSAVRKT